MKKYLILLICSAISLTISAGCENHGISSAVTENTVMESASNQSDETTDWNLTTYQTVNNFDGVTMIIKEGIVTSTKLTIVFENNSSSQCIYGEYYLLEKKINGKWYQVPVSIDGNYGFNSIGYDLTSGTDREWEVDWDWLYGSLDTGEYRIVKDIMDFRDSGDYDTYYLTAEFEIN